MSMFGIGSGDNTSAEDNKQTSSGASSPIYRGSGALAQDNGVAQGANASLQTGGVQTRSGNIAGGNQQTGKGNVQGKNALNLANAKVTGNITIQDSDPGLFADAINQIAAFAKNSTDAAQGASSSLGEYFSQLLQAEQQSNQDNLSQLAALSQPQQIPRLTLYIILAMLAAAVLAIFALFHKR